MYIETEILTLNLSDFNTSIESKLKSVSTSIACHLNPLSRSEKWIEVMTPIFRHSVSSCHNHSGLVPDQKQTSIGFYAGSVVAYYCSIISKHLTAFFSLLPKLNRQQMRLNSYPPEKHGCHFAGDIFRCIFQNGKFCILMNILLKFVPKGQIDNNPTLV